MAALRAAERAFGPSGSRAVVRLSHPGLAGGFLRGRLLVADPRLTDPNFERAVVLLLAHGADGAVGVVLNRPGDLEVEEALAEWGHLAAAPAVVFVGGPVEPGGVICLAQRRGGARLPLGSDGEGADGPERWSDVIGPVGVFHIEGDPADAEAAVDALRFFAGYAGWAPGQLEEEIEAGGWFVVDAEPADALSTRPAQLWRDVLRRQRSPLALVASYPADPEMN